ncbi:MAG: PHP domain-containing protein [Kofleriaceae bacterium]|nr:PHP domain-containing protein [Kofleriaceae bacterium]
MPGAAARGPGEPVAARAAAPVDAGVGEPVAAPAAPDAAVVEDLPWLRGSTHVHAAPSGDSTKPVPEVIAWYAAHGYDFIALTDHNRVTDVDGDTAGAVAVHVGDDLIVLGGVELTYNPGVCDPPPPEPDGKCRIHANLLGVTARPEGKLEWADRDSPRRLDSYQAAIAEAGVLGGMVQINHPQWHWGLTADLLEALAARGVKLVEIANVQFSRWNAGDDRHPSMEALWDAALTAGATVWGVASDDAHDYDDDGGGSYPAGGGWVMVHARREPQAILDALAAGRFYSSTGVTLARAEVDGDALVVEVAADEPGDHRITFVGDGRVLGEVDGRSARWPLDHATSYVRAVVTRDDGARAWVQPVR